MTGHLIRTCDCPNCGPASPPLEEGLRVQLQERGGDTPVELDFRDWTHLGVYVASKAP